jgi:hypothetical protein
MFISYRQGYRRPPDGLWGADSGVYSEERGRQRQRMLRAFKLLGAGPTVKSCISREIGIFQDLISFEQVMIIHIITMQKELI